MTDLKRSFSRIASRGLVVLITAGCIVTPSYAAGIKRPSTVNSNLHLQRLNARDLKVDVFVQLDEPSVSELNINSVKQTGDVASADAQKAQAQRVTAQQSAIRSTLESHGATILSSHRVGANGLHVSVALSEVNALRGLPGVRSVGKVTKYKMDNIDSVPWIGATKLWNAMNVKGKGVKIGIIDSGIDYTHADFGGS
ncbi:MAG TPA: hypothetical protein VHL14_04990, partial [Steroidobacteraceae bacterium]|nr:hypothetical protein [Steroidobacteraceae bacterium]